jgi:hypothetical protein
VETKCSSPQTSTRKEIFQKIVNCFKEWCSCIMPQCVEKFFSKIMPSITSSITDMLTIDHTKGPWAQKISRLFPESRAVHEQAVNAEICRNDELRDTAIECFNGAKTVATMQSPQDALIAIANLGSRARESAGEKIPNGHKEIRQQFLDPNSGMVEFIKKQAPDAQIIILRALASKNGDIAMAALLGACKIGMELESEFFEDLCANTVGGTKFTNLNMNDYLQHSEYSVRSFSDRVSRKSNDALVGESAIAALTADPMPGGAKFFENTEIFNSYLEEISDKIGTHMLFSDINRMSKHIIIKINGIPINMDEYIKDKRSDGKTAAKFILCKLKDSGLSPEQALNAFKAVCRFHYMQGECSRPMSAYHMELLDDGNAAVAGAYSNNIKGHAVRTSTLNFDISGNGTMEINAGLMISEKFIDDYAKKNPARITAPHCAHAYGMAFTSAICDSEGKHELKSSMMACHF